MERWQRWRLLAVVVATALLVAAGGHGGALLASSSSLCRGESLFFFLLLFSVLLSSPSLISFFSFGPFLSCPLSLMFSLLFSSLFSFSLELLPFSVRLLPPLLFFSLFVCSPLCPHLFSFRPLSCSLCLPCIYRKTGERHGWGGHCTVARLLPEEAHLLRFSNTWEATSQLSKIRSLVGVFLN